MEVFPSEEIIESNLASAYLSSGWKSLKAKDYENKELDEIGPLIEKKLTNFMSNDLPKIEEEIKI